MSATLIVDELIDGASEVRVEGEVWGSGVGRSKRLAERCAAEAALVRSASADV